ncbi:glycosyltransferase family 2 protein [Psychroflexus sediminis]|uniref:Glycosyltransferase involved in cell wall bisynthesis n=1 Tax=Psychroflexus sediminis TaxID=470826 RepID=A0A1G7Z2J7_9FLAO|nr:glycosyltransferase [Psychroflexus sediminis]SDH02837.1 Glycosyltransferase involved in cell wall bisynthesis [Psychroflexus sediminis]
MIKLSIIIPVYNVSNYLNDCLSSVVNQTFKSIEIIVINDGSTDGSSEICNTFKTKYPSIVLINQKNKGVSSARNEGLTIAKGEWVYFLDADDYLDNDIFESIFSHDNHDIDVIQFGLRSHKNGIIQSFSTNQKEIICSDSIDFLNKLTLKPVSACLHLIKRDVLIKNNITFDEDMTHNEDMLFMYKVFAVSSKFKLLNKVFYNQVIRENSATRITVDYPIIKQRLIFIDRLVSFLSEKKMVIDFKKEVNNLCKYYFVQLSKQEKISKEIIEDYKFFFRKNKFVLSDKYLIIAFYNFNLIIWFLRVKTKFRTTINA